jgi:hypothetical protein
MDTKSDNTLGMLQSTQLCLDANKPLFKDMPSITRGHLELNEIVAAVLAAQRQQAAREGLAEEKAHARQALIDIAVEVCSVAHACAQENGLTAIATRTDLPRSTFEKGSAAVLVDRCKGVLTDAQELDSEIEKCELTSAQLKAFEAAIKQFDTVKLKPRQGISEGKNATQTLRVLFARASTLLRSRLDRLMVPFQASQPEFYASYLAARKVVNLSPTRAVSGSVSSTADETASPTIINPAAKAA